MKQKLTLLTLSLLVAGWQVQAAPQAASTPRQASAPAASAPAAAANSAAAQPVTAVGLPEIKASAYAVYDAQSGQMLASHKLNEHIEPASLTKLMTAYLVFKALEEGKLKPDQTFTVSEQGWKVEGSRMFLDPKTPARVDDLLKGLIVQSGNDASITLAEAVAGSEAQFVQLMNAEAKRLGMKDTHYTNPTGLPDPQHYTTARDIAILSRHIINDHPQYYHYYGQKSYTYNKIKQDNRNRLLWRNASIDGLKTGHTKEAGYCLASSEKRGDIRFIAVVLGADKESDRYDASQALFNYGFAQFEEAVVLQAGQKLATASVYKGKKNEVNVRPQHEVKLLLPLGERSKAVAALDLQNPLIAPISEGQELGTIRIRIGDKVYATLPAVAAEPVEEAGFFKRMWHSIKLLF